MLSKLLATLIQLSQEQQKTIGDLLNQIKQQTKVPGTASEYLLSCCRLTQNFLQLLFIGIVVLTIGASFLG